MTLVDYAAVALGAAALLMCCVAAKRAAEMRGEP